jgi:hypothetical protein
MTLYIFNPLIGNEHWQYIAKFKFYYLIYFKRYLSHEPGFNFLSPYVSLLLPCTRFIHFQFVFLSPFLKFFFEFFAVERDWVHLVRRPLSDLLYSRRMVDDESGVVVEMRIGRGNRNTRRKPAPVPLCPPQIPHDLTPGSNPGRRGGRPATNGLSYGTAYLSPYTVIEMNLYPYSSRSTNVDTTRYATLSSATAAM